MLALRLARGTAVRVAPALHKSKTSKDLLEAWRKKAARDCNCASPSCLLPQLGAVLGKVLFRWLQLLRLESAACVIRLSVLFLCREDHGFMMVVDVLELPQQRVG